MHRLVVAALIASAFGTAAASAQSLPPTPSYYASSGSSAAGDRMASPPPIRTSHRDMGGGFIEAVFGDPRRPAPPLPPARFDPSLPVEEPLPRAMPPQAVIPGAGYSPDGYGQGYA